MKENEQQFTDIVRRNRSTIYTVCYMFSKDNDEVADMFQEVLIRLWNGMESFDGRSNIKTWIYRVALNTCITIDKRKKRNHKAQLSMDVDYFNSREVKSEQAQFLHRRISRLQPLDRAIVLYGSKTSATTKLLLSSALRQRMFLSDWCASVNN